MHAGVFFLLFEAEDLLTEIPSMCFFSHPPNGFQFSDLLPNILAQFTLFGKIANKAYGETACCGEIAHFYLCL